MACGTDQDLTVDHVIALGQAGATNDPSNLQVLCRSCNSTKGDQTIDYRTNEQRNLIARLP
jgi:5-methylcytosine-specific restriction endonuclease McrA